MKRTVSKWLAACLIVIFSMTCIVPAVQAAPTSAIVINLDGKKLPTDQAPIIKNGRTLVPMRVIFEALGASVTWNGTTKTITSVRDDVTIVLTLNSKHMKKNDHVIALDEPAQALNGRTLVPLRAIAEALGAQVEWIAETNSVDVQSKPTDPNNPWAGVRTTLYPGDENAPDWMVHYKLVERIHNYAEHTSIKGNVILENVYITKPDDMTTKQWERLKAYYKDKKAPECIWYGTNSMGNPQNWKYERYWPDKIFYDTYVDAPDKNDTPSADFAQKNMGEYLWSLYTNMENNNPQGGNHLNLTPTIPQALSYERHPGDEDAPDWLVRHVTEVDEWYYREVYTGKPADMTSSEWAALKNYWRSKERPGLENGITISNLTYPYFISYGRPDFNTDFVQTITNPYIYSLYNYMYNDMLDGVANDARFGTALHYSGDWLSSLDWRTEQIG